MFVGSTRILFSMSRAKMLPTVFSKLHPKYGSPTAAITLVGVLGLISPLLGKNALGWFVDASSFGTVVAYLTVSISFVMVRVAIQNFLKNPVISMVFGHPNRKISCISPHIRATVLRQPPFFTPKI